MEKGRRLRWSLGKGHACFGSVCIEIAYQSLEMKRMVMVPRKSSSVTSRQVEVLVVLSRSASCSIGEIASAFDVSYAAASKMINRLEDKGLVTRSINEMDRRAADIRITEKGTQFVRLFDIRIDKERGE
jgi:DNA-binding MarR family transcriptional regulator